MTSQRKPLWPGLICVLGFWGNLLFGIGFLITIPDGMADMHNPSQYVKYALYLVSIAAIISAFSYWIVGTGYDWGRWLKLAANATISAYIVLLVVVAHNINLFNVVAPVVPLLWPFFLLYVFRRKK